MQDHDFDIFPITLILLDYFFMVTNVYWLQVCVRTMAPIKKPNKFQVLSFKKKSGGVVTLGSTQTLESKIESLQVNTQVLVLSRTIPSSNISNLGLSIPIIETNIEIDEPKSFVLITHVAKKGNLNDKSFKISKTLELPNFHGLNLSQGKMLNYTNV